MCGIVRVDIFEPTRIDHGIPWCECETNRCIMNYINVAYNKIEFLSLIRWCNPALTTVMQDLVCKSELVSFASTLKLVVIVVLTSQLSLRDERSLSLNNGINAIKT